MYQSQKRFSVFPIFTQLTKEALILDKYKARGNFDVSACEKKRCICRIGIIHEIWIHLHTDVLKCI